MDIIEFWFPDDGYQKFWFDRSVDVYIENNYKKYLNFYESFEINPVILSDEDILKIIILFDQFSRNIYRNSNKYPNDNKALNLAKYFFENRYWKDKKLNHLIFYLMPYRHNESLENYKFIFDIIKNYVNNNLTNKEIKLLEKFRKITQIKYKNYINLQSINI